MNPDIDPEIGNETSIINLSCNFNTLFRAGTKHLRIWQFWKAKNGKFSKIFFIEFLKGSRDSVSENNQQIRLLGVACW